MKRLLVTGGSGFIGSNFIRYMLAKHADYAIVNLDKLTYAGNEANLVDVEANKNYAFLKGDIADAAIVKEAMKGCDFVVNFAAESHVDRSISNAMPFLETNVKGCYVLLEEARAQKVERFVQISTDEVYGSIEKGSATEVTPLHPSNPYAASKAAADHLVLAYANTFSLDTVVVRSTNNFGPYQFPEKIVPLAITNALQGKKVPVYGAGKNIRDWLFVLDNCSAIDLALHEGELGGVYNVSAGNPKTNLELVKAILSALDKDEGLIDFVPDRPGHDLRYGVDSTKLRYLGWKPVEKFDEALKYTVQWYQENEAWWKPLLKKAVK